MKSLKNVLCRLTDELRAEDSKSMLFARLVGQGVLSTSISLGGGKGQDVEGDHGTRIRGSNDDGFKLDDVRVAIRGTLAALKSPYAHRRRRADMALKVSLGMACMTVLVVIVIAVVLTTNARDVRWFEALSAALPAAVGSIILVFYKTENEALIRLEKDQQQVSRVSQLLDLASLIDDEKAQARLISKVVDMVGK